MSPATEAVVGVAFRFVLSWTTLVAAIRIVQDRIGLGVPETRTLWWQTAAISLATSLTAAIPGVGAVLALIPFYLLATRWFQPTLMGCAVLWIVQLGLSYAVVSLLALGYVVYLGL